jgi:hypothetical protein
LTESNETKRVSPGLKQSGARESAEALWLFVRAPTVLYKIEEFGQAEEVYQPK